MQFSARIQAIVDALDEILESPHPADNVLSRYFRDRRYIGSKDRAFIADKIYEILREIMRLSWWCDQTEQRKTGRSFFLAHSILGQSLSLTELERLFDGEKFSPSPLKRSEKEFCIALFHKTLSDAAMDEATRLECPDWAYPLLKETFGDQFETEMAACLAPAPLDLRVNLLKASRDDAQQRLKDENIWTESTPFSPWGLRSTARPALSRSETFQNGLVEIQDEGSQLIAWLCDAKPGQQVLDLCAGAGGKTLALAAQMQNKGRLIACDTSEGRLRRSKERLRRANVNNAETRLLNADGNKWLKRNEAVFDRVLVDAPCSGTGTWRRNPDLRWRMPDLNNLLQTQKELLDRAAKLVKPGGLLVYATCSLLKEENQNQITDFLARQPSFKIQPIQEKLNFLKGDFMEMTPARHNTDGFFAAVLLHDKA